MRRTGYQGVNFYKSQGWLVTLQNPEPQPGQPRILTRGPFHAEEHAIEARKLLEKDPSLSTKQLKEKLGTPKKEKLPQAKPYDLRPMAIQTPSSAACRSPKAD